MKTGKWVLCLGIAALLAGLCAHSAWADLYWETESLSINVPNRPDGTSIQKYYFTPDASRVELGGGRVFIVNYNAMELYSLNTRKKTCTELSLTALPGLPAAGSNAMAQIMGAVMRIQVTPTNELKTIAGYRCRRYNVRTALVEGEYWLSKEVRGYRELKTLAAKAAAVADLSPMLRRIDVAGMLEKLDGFPVYTVNHVLGGTVTSTLRRVGHKSLDPALFAVPEGCTLKKNRL